MIIDWEKIHIYIKPGITDMRKQINGLAEIIDKDIKKKALEGDLFLFCGRDRRRLKIIYWDKNGFCLWLKRLEEHKFPWPINEKECMEITFNEIKMLLSGIDFFNAHQEIKYTCIS